MKKKCVLLTVQYPGHYRVKGIDLNKLTLPVLELAMEKAEKRKVEICKKAGRELRKASSFEENCRIYDKYEKICRDIYLFHENKNRVYICGLHPDQVMVPSTTEALLEYLSRMYLLTNPKHGVKMILEAYHEYYGTGVVCERCGRVFTPNRHGRRSKYCSNACRQKAYREKQRRR